MSRICCTSVKQCCDCKHEQCLRSLFNADRVCMGLVLRSSWVDGVYVMIDCITSEKHIFKFIEFMLFNAYVGYVTKMFQTTNIAFAYVIQCLEKYPDMLQKLCDIYVTADCSFSYHLHDVYVMFCTFNNYTGLLLLDRILLMHHKNNVLHIITARNYEVFREAWQTYIHCNSIECFIHVIVHGYNIFPTPLKKIVTNHFHAVPTLRTEIEFIHNFMHSQHLSSKLCHAEECIVTPVSTAISADIVNKLPSLEIPQLIIG